ncbi:MAG: TIGR01777 family protein [bacterium]|nr:TIGR01777 family protein [bacterium]
MYSWHMRIGALERLTPPWSAIQVTWGDEQVREGSRRELLVPAGPIRLKWLAKHHSIIEGRQFVDEQERGPFRTWIHRHLFSDIEGGRSELEDRIDYDYPLGSLGELFGRRQVHWLVNTSFPWRHERTWLDLTRHAEFAHRPRLKVAVTGSSGLVGQQLSHFLTTGGHSVWPVVRKRGQSGTIYWNPDRGEIDRAALEGLDAVIHLAGRNIAAGRWTESGKRAILDSRVRGTRLLAETLAQLKTPPGVFVSASAVGVYADTHEALAEDGPQGDGFLADVVRAWEAAAEPARHAGIRVVHPRISTVISGWGGVLGRLLPVFKAGLGGKIGGGAQAMSWVHVDDLIAAVYRMLYDDRLFGPVNVSSDRIVTNQEFTVTLGKVLGRPTLATVPEAIVKLVFGQMGRELLLQGVRARPGRLNEVGFVPWFGDLESALRFETGKPFSHQPPFHPTPLPQSGQNGYLIS